jgi:hypothetical protein
MLVAASAGTADASRWLHVRVKDFDGDGESVRINFPVRSAAKLLALVDEEGVRGGRVRFNGDEMDADRLRAIWEAVREAEDGEFVSVEGDDENVLVSRSGNYMLVKVEDRDGRERENVDIRIPVPVVDALLSGKGDELNLAAAIEALDVHGNGEIISVDGDDAEVRIWVDENQSGQDGGGR